MTAAHIIRLCSAAFCLILLTGCGPEKAPVAGGPPVMRRLTEAQYRNIVADIFGSDIVVTGRFDPLVRTGGLLEVGAAAAPIPPAGLERFEQRGRAIAAQITDPAHREILMPCAPVAADAADDSCAAKFLAPVGRLLFRRSLTQKELDAHTALAHQVTDRTHDFYRGIAAGLTAMLTSPNFLFVVDDVEAVSGAGQMRLTASAMASRLSFFLWNSAPDDLLLAAAERGELEKQEMLVKQVDRMMASPRMETGVRAFFSDMLSLEDFETLEKDGALYPAFSDTVARDSREQILRTIVDQLLTRKGDYRDLFTTKSTFISAPLGRIYHARAPIVGGWARYEFPEGDQHAGIQSEAGFVALHAHPGRSSPTLRGRAIRELLLCQKIPDPPANVNFDLFNDPNSPHRTARERLTVHATAPACAGCHMLMDPLGLALENFDGAGQTRLVENGETIDPSGTIDGIHIADAPGLGKALHDNPATVSCLVQRSFGYATARAVRKEDGAFLQYLESRFRASGYRYTELIREIAISPGFYAVTISAKPAVTALNAAQEPSK